jgi:predicted nucleic acid-binding Zn ribbon protein
VTEPAIPPPPPPPPARACDECGAALDERQEICVECGHTAGPPERRRIRRALPTASIAAFAILLGASAAYGLSAGGASNVKDLGVGPKKPVTPDTVAQAAPTPPPATGTTPDTVPQATPTPPPASTSSAPATPKPSTKAKATTPAATTPSTSSPAPSSSSGGTTTTHHRHHTTHHHHHHATPPPSWLADGDPPYDAFNYGGGSKPKQAIDGSTKTAWKAGSSGIGIVVDTGQAQPYSAVGIATSTPGYAVTIYSSNDNKGSGDPSGNGWKRVGRASSVAKYQEVAIKSPNTPPRYLLVYITKLPSGSSSAAVNEIKLIL